LTQPIALTLVEEKICQTNAKNRAISYGLTLVVGLPFPEEICRQVQEVQDQLERLLPDRFCWYRPDQLHATLIASLRGRFREQSLLHTEELPITFSNLLVDLTTFFAQLQPFPLALHGVCLTPAGVVGIGVDSDAVQIWQAIGSLLAKYPGLDEPKHDGNLQINFGYLKTTPPFASGQEQQKLGEQMHSLAKLNIGETMVQHVWLVHYATRTLATIVGKIAFPVGNSLSVTTEHLLQSLNLTSVPGHK
jgi:hypothetical protein